MIDLATLGQILLRLSPPKYERLLDCQNFEIQLGGAELNVAVGASSLGLNAAILSKIPVHDIGQLMIHRISSYGVNSRFLVTDNHPDSRIGIYYYEYGAYPRLPKVIYDRGHSSFLSLRPDEFPDEIYRCVRCFHTSGITLALGKQMQSVAFEMLTRFKKGGAIISFDVNYRANMWSGEEARYEIEKFLPYVDIFFCSEDTARMTFAKKGTVKEIMKDFCEKYPISIVASTQRVVHSAKSHTFGSIIYNSRENLFYEEEPYRNIDVIDRIGSGDAYISGVLYGLLSSSMDCVQALKYGNATGALKNTIPGDLLLTNKHEIDRTIVRHTSHGWHAELDR